MEDPMKKSLYFAVAAALLMASTAAQARGISFNIEGQKIRIEAPRHCISLSCFSVTDNGSSINMKHMNLRSRKASDDVEVASNSPQIAPPASPAPAVQASPAPAPAANTAPPAPPVQQEAAAANNVLSAPAPAADASRERTTSVPSAAPASATSTVPVALKPAPVADAAPPAPPAPPVQQAAAPAATTPLGLWQTQQGNVRVEQCGANLCGYGEKNGKKSNELVLINMKPSSDHSKWAGRIYNPNSGKNYDGTVAMKGPNVLSVQGCILGGAFCGGTTWKRVS
jgi:uncharacterized protein (DUF2147 family)